MPDNTSIWKKPISLKWLESFSSGSMVSHIGIEFIEIGPDFLKAKMPVNSCTHQPVGLLHGGASVALAETVASTAAYCAVEEGFIALGIEINANHVRKIDTGWVTAVSRPLHMGSSTHVWQTTISDEQDRLISISRMTLSILKKR